MTMNYKKCYDSDFLRDARSCKENADDLVNDILDEIRTYEKDLKFRRFFFRRDDYVLTISSKLLAFLKDHSRHSCSSFETYIDDSNRFMGYQVLEGHPEGDHEYIELNEAPARPFCYVPPLYWNHTESKRNNRPGIEKVIFNYPATIIFWKDGTKTVVRCNPNDVYDEEKGLAMAIAKKFLGNQYDYYNIFLHWLKPVNKEHEAVRGEFLKAALDGKMTSEDARIVEGLVRQGVDETIEDIRRQLEGGEDDGK